MKIFGRLLFVLLALMFVFSCKEKEPGVSVKPVPPKDSTQTISPDTSNPYVVVDVSPMDMSYYPVDYQKNKSSTTTGLPLARLIYSRPHLQGRKLFDDILKYTKISFKFSMNNLFLLL